MVAAVSRLCRAGAAIALAWGLNSACAAGATVAAAWDGMWMGQTQGGPQPLDVIVDVVSGDTPSVKVTIPAAGIMLQPFDSPEVNAEQVKAKWTMGGTGLGVISITMKPSEAHSDTAQGTLHLEPPGTKDPIDHQFTLMRKPRAETVKGAQNWVAALATPVGSLEMGLILAELPNGTAVGALSIPQQGLELLPLYVDKQKGGAWNIVVPVPVPARLLLAPVDEKLEGRFQQGPTADEPITFRKAEAMATTKPAKPQTPQGPFPYSETPAVVKHPDGHVLAGTLLLPKGASPSNRVAAVVMATGSGAQNRNEELLGHVPFLVLADALARAGIASFRYDDRGYGESTGNFAAGTSLDFASDLNAAYEWLKSHPCIDPKRVGVLGHSEGGILAAIVAGNAAATGAENPPAFAVLMAGTGVPGKDVLVEQNQALLKAAGVQQQTLEAMVAAHKTFVEASVRGDDDEKMLLLARALVKLQLEQARAGGMDVPADAAESLARQAVTQMRSPWIRTFLTLDPAVYLRKVKAPVLALNGGLDTQVVAAQNIPAIRKALAQDAAGLTVLEYPGLNHLFQPATTGSPDEYAKIETTIDPAVLRDIAQWIRAQTHTTSAWTPPVARSAPSAAPSAPPSTPPPGAPPATAPASKP